MSKVNTGNEHELRDLLASAGHRPAVPADELGEIRAAARESWQSMVAIERQRARFRRARNVFALAASIALAVAIGWWLLPGGVQAPAEIVASVTMIQGEVAVAGSALLQGGELEVGTLVDTGARHGAPTRVALRLADGQSVRIDDDSRVRLVSESTMALERGAVYIDTAGSVAGSGVEISTPFGLVRDIGTQFEVRVDQAGPAELTVRVREGEIALERGGQSHSAQAGEELHLQGDDLGRTSIAPGSQVWSWIMAVTPAMDIEGATLGSYLGWVCRETGRELHFEDEVLAVSSEAIVIHGSIDGMTPEESLDVVLPGSGFGYRVENGSLLIVRP